MHRVSVIVPAYQAAHFLDTALASVAAQSLAAHEVVVVDDASTDGTHEVASRWAGLLPLEVLRKPVNEGLGAARRDGIARSTGDLIAPLDADDVWLPDHLDVLVRAYDERGGVIVAQSYDWVPGERLGSRLFRSPRSVPPADRQPVAVYDRCFGSMFCLFSREDYNRAGGFRPLRVDEDWDLWIRMVRTGTRLSVAPSVTSVRRVHGASLSAAEGCLEHDLALLEEQRPLVQGRSRRAVERSIRRREARRTLFEGYAAARRGDTREARRLWLRAAAHDRSLRAPFVDGAGSVTLRALACMVAPGRTVGLRDQRAADPDKRVRLTAVR